MGYLLFETKYYIKAIASSIDPAANHYTRS